MQDGLQRGYLHNQVLFTRRTMRSELLSNMSSILSDSLPLTFIVRCLVTTGSSTISNQLEAGSIMVRAMKSICEPSFCWKVSARPSALLPLKSNLSVVPTGRPKALGRPRSLQCNKTVLLLVLLVKLQSYDVWKPGKFIAQT